MASENLSGTELDLSQSVKSLDAIQKVYAHAEREAITTINWYNVKKNRKSWWSRACLGAALVLLGMGSLVPLIVALTKNPNIGWLKGVREQYDLGQLGYIFAFAGGGLLLFDRWWGFSSGWTRFIITSLVLQRGLRELQMDWVILVSKASNPPSPEQVQLMLARIKEFVLFVDSEVQKETQAWVAEFQSNLSELQKLAKTQQEVARYGRIDVTVSNGRESESGVSIWLDTALQVEAYQGATYAVESVSPGQHAVRVQGRIGGQEVQHSVSVQVAAGATAVAIVALPFGTIELTIPNAANSSGIDVALDGKLVISGSRSAVIPLSRIPVGAHDLAITGHFGERVSAVENRRVVVEAAGSAPLSVDLIAPK